MYVKCTEADILCEVTLYINRQIVGQSDIAFVEDLIT